VYHRIVCLTEEPTEILYRLGEDRRIVGISGFTVRPPRARREKPKVSAFLTAKIDRILELEPDLVLGFSDIQAGIAAELIREGVEVHIFNHRSVAGILRTVGDASTRFAEEFLRILRALRFAGRFALAVEPETWSALCEHRQHLADLSPERVREELTKTLRSAHPSRALSLYAASGVLPILYPELARCVNRRGDGRPDSWSAALQMVDIVSRRYPLARLACLLGGIGVPSGGVGEELPPEERAGMRAAALMARLRYSRADTEGVNGLLRAVAAGPEIGTGPALRRWLHQTRQVDRRHLFRIWIAHARLETALGARDPERAVLSRWGAVRAELAKDPPLALADLALSGRDLIEMGMRPGPGFGAVLAHLLDLVLDDPALNRGTILALRARRYVDARARAARTSERPA